VRQIWPTLRSSQSVCVEPGASWCVVRLAVTLERLVRRKGAHEQIVDIEAAVKQSSSAAAALRFSTEHGTFPRQKAERIAERMVTLYGDPVGTEGPLVIPLRYFDSEEDYVEYATRISWVNPRWHGFYDTGRKEIVVGNRGAGFEILVHEVSHFIVGRVLPGAPRWFDEGLSEYFERASFRGDGTRWSAGASHQSGLADWSKAGQRPDLRELMGMNTWTWIDHDWEKGYIVRALAWSVVDLMMSSEGNKTLRDFIGAVRERSGRHSYEALERTYPGGARAFEGAWLERVNRQVGLAH
jgi:hypothetical protein